MLSILIPVYNYDITMLVYELHRQARDLFIVFEIIVMEDGSTDFLDVNKTISALSNCNYIVLKKNIGRSAIRNKLADAAKYDYLLFLDCDAAINNRYFLARYVSCCIDTVVVLGGRIYDDKDEPDCSLIKKYGKNRERNDVGNLAARKKHQVFTSPNFLISKSIFESVRFNETIKGYGHEDTIFGIEFEKNGFQITFIDNPVVHVGLENNKIFISKTENALSNLYHLYQSGKYPTLPKSSKILSTFIIARKFRLQLMISSLFKLSKRYLLKNLTSENPSLFLFDCYKLGFLCQIKTSQHSLQRK